MENRNEDGINLKYLIEGLFPALYDSPKLSSRNYQINLNKYNSIDLNLVNNSR